MTKELNIDDVDNFTKKELSKLLAQRTDAKLFETSAFVDEFFDLLSDVLVSGKRVSIKGLGTFYSKETTTRRLRSNLTGELLELKPQSKIYFRSTASLNKAATKRYLQEHNGQ